MAAISANNAQRATFKMLLLISRQEELGLSVSPWPEVAVVGPVGLELDWPEGVVVGPVGLELDWPEEVVVVLVSPLSSHGSTGPVLHKSLSQIKIRPLSPVTCSTSSQPSLLISNPRL